MNGMHGAGPARPHVALASVVVLLAGLALTSPAAAYEYPLLPHLGSFSFFPPTPNDQGPTWVQLSAYFPTECWSVLDHSSPDSSHVWVSLQRDTVCNDSSHTWVQSFDLGQLTRGPHELHITVYIPGINQPGTVESTTVAFDVAHLDTPPPPPPPVDSTGMLILSTEVVPTEPKVGDTISVRVRGRYPYPCGQIVNAAVVDTAHLAMTMQPGAACPDTTRTWEQTFLLGALPAGWHHYLLTASIEGSPGRTTELHGVNVLVYEVNGPPPPPPPPPPVDSTGTLILSAQVDPAEPKVGDAITVNVRGRYPYPCGEIVNAAVVDTAHLVLTMQPGPACTDTTLRWEHSYSLGALPAGWHHYLLTATIDGSPGRTSEQLGINILVFDPNAPPPPPPPPPGDSLNALMSASRPNPFREQTRFSVSLADPVQAEVAVFDLGGRRVATVFRGTLPRGTSELVWNGHRSDGSAAPGGLYFYRLSLPNRVVSRRVVLLGTP